MRLRQKKTYSLSEEAFYLDFQNQQFQTLNRKTDTIKKSFKNYSSPTSLTDNNQRQSAYILAQFINSINLTKHSQDIKTKITQPLKNVTRQQINKQKRFRKPSENTSFDEEKKVDYPKSTLSQVESINRKIRTQQKRQKGPHTFSTNKPTSIPTDSFNKRKDPSEQNIINNCSITNSFNIADYARFIQSPLYTVNPQVLNAWYQINPFFKLNFGNLPFFSEDMRSGLNRQFQIYERFKPQSAPSEIQSKPLPLTVLNRNQQQKTQKLPEIMQPSKKMSPDKIFKRASFHVGIAYSIYMDSIQKEGKRIDNFSDIDPTRFAKKFKNTSHRY